MVTSVLDYNSEAGFLQSSFVEFVKCWSMGKRSTFHVESVNGEAFLNFSAYLGLPRNVHFYQWRSSTTIGTRKHCWLSHWNNSHLGSIEIIWLGLGDLNYFVLQTLKNKTQSSSISYFFLLRQYIFSRYFQWIEINTVKVS